MNQQKRQMKAAYVDEFQKKMEKAKVVVLAACEGVTVDEMTRLRREIRKLGDEARVVKNTMLRRACQNLKHENVLPHLTGSTLMTFGYHDPVAPVKALFDFAQKASKLKFKAGLLGDQLLSVQELENLSKLPGREQLLSMLLSCMQGPMRNMVGVLSGVTRKFVYALNAIKEKKEKAAA
ncbi:MAG TPA: 50S ribosomal protein L10 [Candidatus Ozemobacteraceae bacterium]|nr:50S ribosomal protein L10 [Candidatus Ozemobacteraceae bacterium]